MEDNNKPQPEQTHPEDNGVAPGKTFTQEEVNRIVSDRLAREREKAAPPPEDEREKALNAREAKVNSREYIAEKGYPQKLLEVFDPSDFDKFKAQTEALIRIFPDILAKPGRMGGMGHINPDVIADAFKPKY